MKSYAIYRKVISNDLSDL